jgi:hypothetical protein
MCGLPGHTYNECLVFFGKPGVTNAYSIHQLRVTWSTSLINNLIFLSFHTILSFNPTIWVCIYAVHMQCKVKWIGCVLLYMIVDVMVNNGL